MTGLIKTGGFLTVLMLLLASVGAAQVDITLALSLDRSTIRADESAMLTLTVEGIGAQQMPEPELPPLPMFEIFSSGNSTNIQVINGQMSTSMIYNYILYPKRDGTFPIRAAHVVYNGKRYESNELSITVTKAGTGAAPDEPSADQSKDSQGGARDVFLTAEVDKKSAYVDEQVTLRVKLFRAINTLSTPDYEAPQTPGFWTQDIPPQKTYYQIVNGRRYFVNEIRTALFPTKPGKLSVSAAKVTVTVPDRSRTRTRDPFSIFDDVFQQGKRVSVQSHSLSINVRALPKTGKTADFSGGVGSYKISATVDKPDVQVNEAITLTVKISGQGNVKSIPEPTLPDMDGFRVEKASTDFQVSNLDVELGGSKTFEYLLIPRIPGPHVIDPIKLNYFDPGKEKYITAKTDSIALKVRKGDNVAETEIPYNMVAGQTINLKETDIRFIKVENGHLARTDKVLLASPLFLAFLALPLAIVLGGMIDVKRKRRLQSDIAYARRRRASGEAKRRLNTAEKHMHGNNDTGFYAEISAAIYQFVADKFNTSAHGLTTDGVQALLVKQGVADDLLNDTLTTLREADFGRFAGGAGVDGGKRELFDRARAVITRLGEVL